MREAFVLVGPTASGKSDVGQLLAERMHAAILSADSMLVYRDMDIGTAKPSRTERGDIPYLGVDLVCPDQSFDVWQYVKLVGKQVAALPPAKPLLIVGGSGLYVNALVHGLDRHRVAPVERARWERLLSEKGVEGLQAVLRERNPDALLGLADPMNPRRLVRAIEQTYQDVDEKRSWRENMGKVRFAGLLPENDLLRERVSQRVDRMYAAGLLAEAQRLRARYPSLSKTASQAIGYQEAFSVLDGVVHEAEARDRTVVRTNRLAKRQRTWFRHQANVEWVSPGTHQGVETVAAEIEHIWRDNGSIQLGIE